jgi:hypothetical protein
MSSRKNKLVLRKMTKRKEPIEEIDWRHRVATFTTKDSFSPSGDVIYKKGTPVTLTTYAKYNETEIGFGDPSASALFLNQAHKSFQVANEINPFRAMQSTTVHNISTTKIYDYLEAICASIIFALTSLEAFTNEEIPNDFIYEVEETTESGISVMRHYNKEEIERKFSLSEKLASVLPKVKNIPSPKGEKVWDGFVKVKRLRDRIIHMKSKDRVHSKHENMYPESIWSDLLNPNQPYFPSIAKSMILHFKPKDSAHWLKYCPF